MKKSVMRLIGRIEHYHPEMHFVGAWRFIGAWSNTYVFRCTDYVSVETPDGVYQREPVISLTEFNSVHELKRFIQDEKVLSS